MYFREKQRKPSRKMYSRKKQKRDNQETNERVERKLKMETGGKE